MIKEILTHPNEVLNQKCAPVPIEEDVNEAIQDLVDTLESQENGLGLAARVRTLVQPDDQSQQAGIDRD